MPEIPLPDPPLSDGTVALRPWLPEDAAAAAAWSADSEIVRWTDIPARDAESAARAWGEQAEQRRRAGEAIAFAITGAASDGVLGSCDLRRPDPGDPALGEIGYLLAPDARDRGHATAAVGLLVRWGFEALAMERIQALAHPENPRSHAVLDRLGFRREGLLRAYRPGARGREDRIMFAALRGDS